MHDKLCTILVALWHSDHYIDAKLKNLRALEGFNDYWIVLLNCQDHDNISRKYSHFLDNKNVVEIKYDKQINLYPTWNDGINATSSKYIMNSNADDMLHPTCVQRCCSWLDTHQDYACVSTSVLVTHTPNQFEHIKWDHSRKMPFHPYPLSSAGPCPVWRRSLHAKYGYFGDYRVIGDARMWEKWHAGGEKFGLINEDLVLYYRHNRSLEMRVDDTGTSYRDLDLAEDSAKTAKD